VRFAKGNPWADLKVGPYVQCAEGRPLRPRTANHPRPTGGSAFVWHRCSAGPALQLPSASCQL